MDGFGLAFGFLFLRLLGETLTVFVGSSISLLVTTPLALALGIAINDSALMPLLGNTDPGWLRRSFKLMLASIKEFFDSIKPAKASNPTAFKISKNEANDLVLSLPSSLEETLFSEFWFVCVLCVLCCMAVVWTVSVGEAMGGNGVDRGFLQQLLVVSVPCFFSFLTTTFALVAAFHLYAARLGKDPADLASFIKGFWISRLALITHPVQASPATARAINSVDV